MKGNKGDRLVTIAGSNQRGRRIYPKYIRPYVAREGKNLTSAEEILAEGEYVDELIQNAACSGII